MGWYQRRVHGGVNVDQENHKQVVQRIKAIPEEAKLLVVDKVCEEFHREKDIVGTGTLPYVLHLFSEKTEVLEEDQNDDVELLPNESIEDIPDAHSAPTFSEDEIETESLSEKETENDNQIQETDKEVTTEIDHNSKDQVMTDLVNHNENATNHENKESDIEDTKESENLQLLEVTENQIPLDSEETFLEPSKDTDSAAEEELSQSGESESSLDNSIATLEKTNEASLTSSSELDLSMTAKEMRELIENRKKKDIRKEYRMDFRKKHEIVQTL